MPTDFHGLARKLQGGRAALLIEVKSEILPNCGGIVGNRRTQILVYVTPLLQLGKTLAVPVFQIAQFIEELVGFAVEQQPDVSLETRVDQPQQRRETGGAVLCDAVVVGRFPVQPIGAFQNICRACSGVALVR